MQGISRRGSSGTISASRRQLPSAAFMIGGYPWEPDVKRLLDQESPISYVQNIHTPFLIIHGSNDNRTGFVQSQMLFRELREMGRPVEYIRYPGATHELTRSGEPRQRIDHMLRIVEFFERYSQNDRPPPHGATPLKTDAVTSASGSQ
jgi:dipeptidyl aminopeptidase/acylaminoacyl peptidase